MSTEKTVHIRPRAGAVVRDPETMQPLAEAGEHKPLSTFWRRRLRDGDVVEVKAEKPSLASTKK